MNGQHLVLHLVTCHCPSCDFPSSLSFISFSRWIWWCLNLEGIYNLWPTVLFLEGLGRLAGWAGQRLLRWIWLSDGLGKPLQTLMQDKGIARNSKAFNSLFFTTCSSWDFSERQYWVLDSDSGSNLILTVETSQLLHLLESPFSYDLTRKNIGSDLEMPSITASPSFIRNSSIRLRFYPQEEVTPSSEPPDIHVDTFWFCLVSHPTVLSSKRHQSKEETRSGPGRP